MNRFFCVYYTTENQNDVNKENKCTKIIEAENWTDAATQLKIKYDATFIKYIRDLRYSKPSIDNEELTKIEIKNRLKKIG
jgi:hypothetical protein